MKILKDGLLLGLVLLMGLALLGCKQAKDNEAMVLAVTVAPTIAPDAQEAKGSGDESTQLDEKETVDADMKDDLILHKPTAQD
ncbi:MAG: hypothetical protein GX757_00165, partial [Clostridiales bacterium]|nr:hypothetical protein [Clostridiales bacterium]